MKENKTHSEKPKVTIGTILNFGNNKKGRIVTMGDEIMTVELIGKKKIKKDCLGDVITICDVPFEIFTSGKRFKLKMKQ